MTAQARPLPVKGILAALAVLAAGPASAMADDKVMAPLFAESCGGSAPTAEAIEARMNADSRWRRLTDSDLAVEAFATVRPGVPSGPFKRPGPYKQWLRTVDGKEVRLVLVTYQGRYKTLCAVLVPDVKNAMPYLDGFDDALKAMGLKRVETNLPHAAEYHGRLSDRRKSWGQIYSRSDVLGPGRNMHMYVAF